MKKFISRLNNSSPGGSKAKEIADELRRRFAVYQTINLKGVAPEEFARYLNSQIGVIDTEVEDYSESEIQRQRDLSIKFHWGHNHDFGSFVLKGQTGDSHIYKLTNFIDLFPVLLEDLRDSYVFDIGCWTGGTTLLLATVAKKVYAIEEVKKYARMVSYLSKSFGIDDRVSAEPLSIYDCDSEEFFDRFDIVYFPGVIYHLSDPLLALRILFNSLKVGGIMLIESAGINVEEPFCRFDGSLIHHGGTKEELSRKGWNWFVPSPSALYRMMREAGFDEVQTFWHYGYGRIYGYGRKVTHVGICRAGLSVPGIK